MKKTLIILIMVLSSIGYGAWDNTKPSDSGTWNTAAGYIRANWDALEAILGTDLSTFDVNIITVDTAHVGAFDVNTIDANTADITTLTSTTLTSTSLKLNNIDVNTIGFNASGTFYCNTADSADNASIYMIGSSSTGVTRGASIVVFGNEHSTYPGQVMFSPGYLTGTTDANINATTHRIMNVVDPSAMQDAATKNYVDTKTGTAGTVSPAAYTGTAESVTFANGLIIKMGYKVTTALTGTVTFGTAFPNNIVSVVITERGSASHYEASIISAQSVSTFSWTTTAMTSKTGFNWIAIGN